MRDAGLSATSGTHTSSHVPHDDGRPGIADESASCPQDMTRAASLLLRTRLGICSEVILKRGTVHVTPVTTLACLFWVSGSFCFLYQSRVCHEQRRCGILRKHVDRVYELSDGNPMSDGSWSFVWPFASLVMSWLSRAFLYVRRSARNMLQCAQTALLKVWSLSNLHGLIEAPSRTPRLVHDHRGGLLTGLPRRCPPPNRLFHFCRRSLSAMSESLRCCLIGKPFARSRVVWEFCHSHPPGPYFA
jgi:hypothetical protein